jgi:predicted nucleic acid-binding protein
MAGVIILDASVLIAYLDGDDAQHTLAEELLAREIDDEFAANPLTLAEVLVEPARDSRLEQVQAALEDLEIQELPFPADTAVKLALLRAGTGLKMPDCCVLLAAEAAGARVASLDTRLLRAAATRDVPTVER